MSLDNIEYPDENTAVWFQFGFKNLDEYYKSVSDHSINYQKKYLNILLFLNIKIKILEIGICSFDVL